MGHRLADQFVGFVTEREKAVVGVLADVVDLEFEIDRDLLAPSGGFVCGRQQGSDD